MQLRHSALGPVEAEAQTESWVRRQRQNQSSHRETHRSSIAGTPEQFALKVAPIQQHAELCSHEEELSRRSWKRARSRQDRNTDPCTEFTEELEELECSPYVLRRDDSPTRGTRGSRVLWAPKVPKRTRSSH